MTGSFQGVATTASYVLNAVSASFATTASYAVSASVATNAVTASYVLNAVSSSFATSAVTASFSPAFTVAGTLTAQTLVVQTITSSVDFVTGSTRFGSLLANTHAFTGSVGMTGSLAVVGTGTFSGNVSLSNSNLLLGVGNTANSEAIIFSYNSNAASRSWRIIKDWTAFGDFQIQQSTTQTGATYSDILRFTSTGAATFSSSVSVATNITLANIGTTIPSIRATSSSGALDLWAGATGDYDGGAGITLVASDRSGTKTRGELYLSAGNAVNNTANGFIDFATANTSRMRITSTGTVQPGANGTQDLGTASLRWATVYTSDLSLSNGIGDYTIVEGEDDLFLYNNKSNKVYKFMLAEVDPANATPKKST
jgi:hypothetical protein